MYTCSPYYQFLTIGSTLWLPWRPLQPEIHHDLWSGCVDHYLCLQLFCHKVGKENLLVKTLQWSTKSLWCFYTVNAPCALVKLFHSPTNEWSFFCFYFKAFLVPNADAGHHWNRRGQLHHHCPNHHWGPLCWVPEEHHDLLLLHLYSCGKVRNKLDGVFKAVFHFLMVTCFYFTFCLLWIHRKLCRKEHSLTPKKGKKYHKANIASFVLHLCFFFVFLFRNTFQ